MTRVQKLILEQAGISARTLAAHLSADADTRAAARVSLRGYDGHPRDPDDMSRCVAMLNAARDDGDDWRPRIGQMATVSPYWAALVPHWAELETAPFERFDALLNPVTDADPNTVRLGRGITMRWS